MWIFVIWVLINTVIFFLDYFSMASNGYLTSEYDLTSAFMANTVASVTAGLVGGFLTLHLMEYWLRKYAFWKALLIIIIAFTVAAVIVSVLAASYAISEEYQLSVFHPDVVEDVTLFFGTWLFVKNYIIWLFIVISTLIVLMVNDKYGPGIFGDYLLGRYFRPKNERRIFMFADIKDATTIAETLGEQKYFLLLKDFFKDIAPAIVQTRGEVYQYVGDEVVVSWKMKAGLKNGNAINCFYHMKELIRKKSSRYEERYGLVPKFKVGFHFGQVTVGELGLIKRDIAFSGDVLNTTARIQDKCNELGVDILASREFADVAYQLPEGLHVKELGKLLLKGKRRETQLVTFVS
jgi:adenylate cyclase